MLRSQKSKKKVDLLEKAARKMLVNSTLGSNPVKEILS